LGPDDGFTLYLYEVDRYITSTMMKRIKASSISLIFLPALLFSDTNFQVGTGDWNTSGNWSADVPGVTDNNARMNNGGTLNITAPPTITSGVDFRINTGGGANTVNWNPGSGTMNFIAYYAGGGGAGSANVTHDSGVIAVGTNGGDAFRIGNNSPGTYTMNGNATVEINNSFSLGYFGNGAGFLIMNDNSQILDTVNDNGEMRVGNDTAGGTGHIIMNDNSYINGRGNWRLGGVAGATGTIEMSGTASIDNRNEMRVGYGGAGYLIMSGDSVFTTGVGSQNDIRVGVLAGASGTVTMSGNAVIQGSGGNSDDAHIGFNGDGVLTMSTSSTIRDIREFSTSHNNAASTSIVTMNGDSLIDARTFINIGRTGTSTLTLNDNARISNSQNSSFNLAAQATGNASLIMEGVGSSVHANQNLTVAAVNGASVALFDQNAGEVYIAGGLLIGNGVAGNAGTYNLDGGTLRANSIDVNSATGIFNWNAGTMTVREVAQNVSGDGSIINFNGDLTSNTGSTLDLQNLYFNGSPRFDKLAVSGALDLTAGGDILDFWINAQALRPKGGIITGALQLISASSVNGEFDNIIGPGVDGLFFRTYGPGEIAQGTPADSLQLNHGYVDYRPDGVYFVYRLNGQVPEPSTAAYWVIFVGLASAWRNRRSFSFFDFMRSDDDAGPREY
jgi:hypothetical protein